MATSITKWHDTARGKWYAGQMDRVKNVIETSNDARMIRVAQNQKAALERWLAEIEAAYKRGEKVPTTW